MESLFPLLTYPSALRWIGLVLALPSQLTPSLIGFYAALGDRIRTARLRCGLSQEELARQVSLTRTSVTNIEKGRQKVLVHTLVDAARVLKVPVESLLPVGDEGEIANLSKRLPADLSHRVRQWIESKAKTPKS